MNEINPPVTVVIPAFNEGQTVGQVISNIKALHPDFEYLVVRAQGRLWIVAAELLAAVSKSAGWSEAETVKSLVLLTKEKQMVVLVLPAFAHESTLRQIAPYLDEGFAAEVRAAIDERAKG